MPKQVPCKLCGTPIDQGYDLCQSCFAIYKAENDPQKKRQMDYLARKIAVETERERRGQADHRDWQNLKNSLILVAFVVLVMLFIWFVEAHSPPLP
jgi:predicted nucleic acid-binding Zn ribbon protein